MVRALIGPRIRERRRALGLSQAGLAAAVGISASYLNLIEHNKRGIAGRTLNAIANRLGMEPGALSDAGEGELVDSLRNAAAAAPQAGAELDQVPEMIARFPGWARALAAQGERLERLDRAVAALGDRLTHDPYLGEAMHLMLSAVTAIQSTTSILAETEGLTEAERTRFTRNLDEEARRLTRTARELADYFDNPVERTPAGDADQKVQAFWEARRHFSPELERGAAPTALLDHAGFDRAVERAEAKASLERYARVAWALPLAPFLKAAPACGYDPVSLARSFKTPLADAMFRLAHLPPDAAAPAFGLIECDAAGGVLYRKEAAGLSLPRQSGACPLWPLYGALSRPGQPVRATLITPDGARLLAWAHATPKEQPGYDAPAPVVSAMLFTDDAALVAAARAPEIRVGAQCSICPRETCSSRRALFLLA